MNVTVKHIPAKRVFAVTHRGPYNTFGISFSKLQQLLQSAKLPPEHQLEMVAVQYDNPSKVAAAELRGDAGVVVAPEAQLPSGLHEVSIPAGRYAVTLHHGPYEQLGEAWGRFLGGWLAQSGHRLADGPIYERYLNTPMNAGPQELLTELYLQLIDQDAKARR